MKKLAVSIFIILSAAAASVLYVSHIRKSVQTARRISPITFEEVDRMVQSSPSDAELKECSRQLRGTRVRWSGTVTGIDNDQTVFIATNVFPTNVQFDLPRDVVSELRRGQMVKFVGTVESVADAETAPPMFHTYVVLKDVELERSGG